MVEKVFLCLGQRHSIDSNVVGFSCPQQRNGVDNTDAFGYGQFWNPRERAAALNFEISSSLSVVNSTCRKTKTVEKGQCHQKLVPERKIGHCINLIDVGKDGRVRVYHPLGLAFTARCKEHDGWVLRAGIGQRCLNKEAVKSNMQFYAQR